MASTSCLPSLPHFSLPSFRKIPPVFFQPNCSFRSSSSSSFSLAKLNHRCNQLSLSASAQFLPNPLVSSISKHTHIQLPSFAAGLFSLEDAQILRHKCLELLGLSVRYGDDELARAVHCLIWKLEEDNYLSNSLITAYLNLGLLSDAYNVFAGISSPDVVSYNALISGFAKSGYEVQAIRLFMRMRERGIQPNEFTFVALLTACNRISELNLGFQVHCLVVKFGCVVNIFVANAVMGMYIKCGCLEDALHLFDEIPERDIASWNTIISGVGNGLLFERAFELFRGMQRIDGFKVDQFTLSSLLDSCTGCSARKSGREIHAQSLKVGLESNLSVNNALIGFYTKCGCAKDVQALFERMPTKDVISWTGMISAYMEFGKVNLAVEIFNKMPEKNPVSFNAVLAGLCLNDKGLEALSLFYKMVFGGIEMTEYTLTSAISACSLLEEKSISEQIHCFVVKFGIRSNAIMEAALLDMCTRCGRMKDAQVMLCQSQNYTNLSINWTSLLCGYARNAQPEQAIALFQWGQITEAIRIDEVVLTTVLGICGTLGFHDLGKQMHCHALKSGFLYDLRVGNAIIGTYSKCGNMKDAIQAFELSPAHDVVSWNCLIFGLLLQRQGDEALAVWSRMKREFIKPDSITLVLVISSYRHTKSNMLDNCRSLFFSMKRVYDIEPTSDHYASFVSVLGDWGSLEEAEEIVTKMPFEPKASVWRALLHSCRVHLDSTVGKRIAKCILAMQPQDPSTFILISNLYSASGRWHCSEIVREEMRSQGLRKHPARSWIIHQDKVHSFYTRDRSHPQSKDIYSGLELLIIECLKAGYEPDTSFVLHEVEEHQKKDFLYYHSAKLAVTYGLLKTKKPKPIRVTKNILLCGDCHTFFKYVSKVTRREICVRDTSGFHHFSDGNCSCKDQW
uniref:DYW domain-containing protein n=1 Tax=Opuntia streptacantha TaxID=393608 RepID=A0A7C9E0B5_OPUST